MKARHFMAFSIRAKLTLLVGLPVLLVGLTVPILSEAQHRDLADAADDHVEDAQRAFIAEIADDLHHLEAIADTIADSRLTVRGLKDANQSDILRVLQRFSKFYPRLDFIAAAADGRVIASIGPSPKVQSLREISEISDLPELPEPHVLLAHGCSRPDPKSPPAQAAFLKAAESGWVLVCEALDRYYLENASNKLDSELAFVGTTGVLSSTEHFPNALANKFQIGPAIVEEHSKVWALHRFGTGHPDKAHGSDLSVIAAADVTKIDASVHRHLYTMIGSLAAISLVAIALGAWVAGVMARGLRQVVEAYRKLAADQYIQVPVLRTHDEIELLAVGFNRMVEGLRERDKLRTTFGKYMTEAVVEHLLNGRVQLGGDTVKVTILFSDIRSFTTISETMEAHALVELLNEYFTEMVSIVIKHNGVVDKYIGDAIMAVFGAPVPSPDDAKNAVRAAVEMRVALTRLNERLQARGAAPLQTGIGIHTGEVVAGNIGSEQRMEYTVIGDNVNVASRLESNTKGLGVDVLISDATYQETKDIIEARPVAELTVKGRTEPVVTYALTGLRVVA